MFNIIKNDITMKYYWKSSRTALANSFCKRNP